MQTFFLVSTDFGLRLQQSQVDTSIRTVGYGLPPLDAVNGSNSADYEIPHICWQVQALRVLLCLLLHSHDEIFTARRKPDRR